MEWYDTEFCDCGNLVDVVVVQEDDIKCIYGECSACGRVIKYRRDI